MDKKTIIALTIIGILVLFALVLVVNYASTDRADATPSPIQNSGTTTDQSNGFSLSVTYQGNSNWKYVVTGQLPNPCVQVQVDTLVAESYPEQVTVRLAIESDAMEMCAQVITDYRYEGTFTASERATARLAVNE